MPFERQAAISESDSLRMQSLSEGASLSCSQAQGPGGQYRALAEFGKIDVSIQNAGVITIARIEELSENDWDRVMAVNTKGVFLCCQAAAVRMKPRRFGRIINTASGQARQGVHLHAPLRGE